MPLEIREARDDERAAIRAVTLRGYGEYAAAMAPPAWAALEAAVHAALDAEGPVHRLVALRDGAVIGAVQLWPPASDAYVGATDALPWPVVRLLAVDPAARGAGAGRALLAECIRRARAMGADALGLHTSRSMRAAIALYGALGFVREPALDFQPEGAELVEAYRLPLD